MCLGDRGLGACTRMLCPSSMMKSPHCNEPQPDPSSDPCMKMKCGAGSQCEDGVCVRVGLVICPMDVRECPDGTFVSRDSDCAFPACPTPSGPAAISCQDCPAGFNDGCNECRCVNGRNAGCTTRLCIVQVCLPICAIFSSPLTPVCNFSPRELPNATKNSPLRFLLTHAWWLSAQVVRSAGMGNVSPTPLVGFFFVVIFFKTRVFVF